jgi:hypothetical protein
LEATPVSEHDLQDLSGRDKDHGAEAVAGLQRKVRGLQLRQVAGLEFATLQDRPSSWAAVNCYGARTVITEAPHSGECPTNFVEKGIISASVLPLNNEPFNLTDPRNGAQKK